MPFITRAGARAAVRRGVIGPSEPLLNSELSGHEQAAFTDAKDRKLGKLELCHRGTQLLDDIGDTPPELQPSCCASTGRSR